MIVVQSIEITRFTGCIISSNSRVFFLIEELGELGSLQLLPLT